MARTTTAEDFRLMSSFESIRTTLLDERYADRLEKPLAYWALPSDRRLPLAFLGRSLGDLLTSSFDELTATPGIGHKKINSLVTLLHRATHDKSAQFSSDGFSPPRAVHENGNGKSHRGDAQFHAARVSEAMWAEWKETIRRQNLEHEKLGRLAPSLAALPTVIWSTPLSFYLDRSLAEIRELKTHGEKRVNGVLEVFHTVHETLSAAQDGRHLSVRLVPKFIPPLENWIYKALEQVAPPTADELQTKLAIPLLDQVRVDAGVTVCEIAEKRLGIRSEPHSVRMQARQLGVTRARVYQLLEECAQVLEARWPEGRCHLGPLATRFATESADQRAAELFAAVSELFFPTDASDRS